MNENRAGARPAPTVLEDTISLDEKEIEKIKEEKEIWQEELSMEYERRVRILIGKAGLDGHDRGAKIVARALRDAGFEIIYTGLHNTPEMIVETAIQEDVDAVGLSILSGAHNYLFPEIIRLLSEKEVNDIAVFGGGIIPKDDIPELLEKGVKVIFEPGTSTGEIVNWIRENVKPRNI